MVGEESGLESSIATAAVEKLVWMKGEHTWSRVCPKVHHRSNEGGDSKSCQGVGPGGVPPAQADWRSNVRQRAWAPGKKGKAKGLVWPPPSLGLEEIGPPATCDRAERGRR